MLKIDAHSHAGEDAVTWTGKQIVERMDTIGVDKTVIFPFVEGNFHNNDIPKYTAEFPDRLIPFCSVNPWEKKKAIDELELRLGSGFKGLKLHPTLCGFRLSDHVLCDPLFEIVRAHNAVVIV
ncbi:MAG: amidohydrolase family protein, partial [Treponema sp.]|nr:amidohydrolase family protein [Treponema sp.]